MTTEVLEKECCGKTEEKHEKLERVMKAIDSLRGMRGALIPVLHQAQHVYGYLPEEVLHVVSKELDVPMSEIYGVASFYSFFALEPKGEHIIRVCLGTACYVKGAQQILDEFSKVLEIEVNKTTADNKFTLEAARCIGACGLAPVLTVGEKVHGRLTGAKDVKKIVREYKK